MEVNNVANCAICGTIEQLLRCAKCKTVYYCSSAHQHVDWPRHKQECRALARHKSNNKMQQLQLAVAAASLESTVKPVLPLEAGTTTTDYKLPLSNGYAASVGNGEQYVLLGTNEKEILNTQAEACSASGNFHIQHHLPHHNHIHMEQLNTSSTSNDNKSLTDEQQSQLNLRQPPLQQGPSATQFITQFSSHANNQYEKSSSYQIGRVDENHIGIVK